MPAFPSAVVVVLQLALAPAAAPPLLPADTSLPAATRGATAASDAAPAAQDVAAPGPRLQLRFDPARAWALEAVPADTPQPRPRARAITHSDAYYTRLTIHRIASYAILPLFAGEWIVGQKVYNEEPQRSSARGIHNLLGWGIFGAFAANTVTGVWNLVEARHDPGAARRTTHVLLMLAADAGFAATAATIPHSQHINGFRTGPTQSAMNRHRDIAIGSIALGTIGTGIMWLWK
ncbi:MAG TPA: hypothetical protein VF832_16730 [Longimicrobiales bacterium]